MFIQSGVRVQKSKGYTPKQGFQVALIVAFGIWVLYQITHSHGKRKDYGGATEHLVDLKHVTIVLGRKAYAGSTEEQNVDRDKVIDSSVVHDRVVDDQVEANAKENVDDLVLQVNETDSFHVSDQGEPGHGIIGFSDENGVPQDGLELVKFSPNETSFDEQETTVKDQAMLRSQRVEEKSERHNTSKAESVNVVIGKSRNDFHKSAAKESSKTIQENGVALKDSKGFTSEYGNKDVADLKMPSQTGE